MYYRHCYGHALVMCSIRASISGATQVGLNAGKLNFQIGRQINVTPFLAIGWNADGRQFIFMGHIMLSQSTWNIELPRRRWINNTCGNSRIFRTQHEGWQDVGPAANPRHFASYRQQCLQTPGFLFQAAWKFFKFSSVVLKWQNKKKKMWMKSRKSRPVLLIFVPHECKVGFFFLLRQFSCRPILNMTISNASQLAVAEIIKAVFLYLAYIVLQTWNSTIQKQDCTLWRTRYAMLQFNSTKEAR